MFYRASEPAPAGVAAIRDALDGLAGSQDRLIARDRERFLQSRDARSRAAAAYFEGAAAEWDSVRRLHLPDSDIESRMRALIGDKSVGVFVDLGTGTGRMLEIFSDRYEQGLGFDLSREMLAVARANLERAGVSNAQVRQGDIFSLPLENGSADLVCLHQVLHYLAEPGAAVRECARLLRPGGRLLISDFAPHELEFLREEHAHRRLGFSDEEVGAWRRAAGLDHVACETLSPQSRDEKKLTVKIWVLAAPEAVRKLKRASAA